MELLRGTYDSHELQLRHDSLHRLVDISANKILRSFQPDDDPKKRDVFDALRRERQDAKMGIVGESGVLRFLLARHCQ